MTREEFIAAKEPKVKFKGQEFLILKDSGEENGPLCTKEQYENWEESYAHIYIDDGIMRHHECIGSLEDLEFVEENKEELKPTDDSIQFLLNSIISGTFPKFKDD